MTYEEIRRDITKFDHKIYKVGPIIDGKELISPKHITEHFRPSKNAEKIAEISISTESEILKAISIAKAGFDTWTSQPCSARADILRKIANLYHEHRVELYSLLLRESGKSIGDAIAEVREAIDFCNYYALSAEKIMKERLMPSVTGEKNLFTMHGRGVFLCISPWNFPLAIFTGQIVAALVSGNTVIAKPAEQTPVVANFAVKLMHEAGIPKNALHLLIASGSQIGKHAVSHQDVSGVAFTGSNYTAKLINSTLAARDGAIIPIIAETGGQNAMIVDSSALLEQVTDDVLISAFYSAGQRCSSLRALYIQEEIYDSLLAMIIGAVECIKIGDTVDFSNDVGSVIDKKAYEMLLEHVKDMESRGFNVIAPHSQKDSTKGYFFYPHIIEISKISDIGDEKFGPILHVIKYKASELDRVLDEVNDCGYGLTFGVHSRMEGRIEYIRSRIRVGNIYANRSMTGAQVESQPFGGENKSGTGFKAGGPNYLLKFLVERTISINTTAVGGNIDLLKG
jgi:RHH-type proline utilization regulon transcriptional repressor/proline dehydrogenase/delta 1-pyrroline-5-carboxylate dehydrogenase